MKNYRKIAAGLLAATMVVSSSMVAFADEGSTTGAGTLEGTVSTDVFNVDLPTIADGDTTFDFILDPEGLIKETGADRYNNATFGTGTLFFTNVTTTDAGTTYSYSNTSDALNITNYSSIAVDVALSATVSNAEGITLTQDSTFADDTSASVYLAITDGTNTAAITDAGASVNTQMAAAGQGAYGIEWNDTDKKYEYVLDDSDDTLFATYSFQLTGASNANGDWSGLADIAPSVEVVWNVTAHSDAYLSSTTLSVGAETVTLNLPENVTISNVVLNKTDGSTVVLASGNTYTLSDNTLGIKAAIVSAYPGATITVTYSDGRVETLTIQ